LIYFGFSAFRDPADRRRSLFTDESLTRLAVQQGVQVNVIARADSATSSTEDTEELQNTARESGGRFFQYRPAGADAADTLSGYLDQIENNEPTAHLPGGKTISVHSADSPEAVLVGSLLAAALLSLSLAVLRRCRPIRCCPQYGSWFSLRSWY
jgi:hypothetical protein